ncbi:type IV pilus assembly protein PilM [Clostridium bovifaecis]|uniref:Type IV pilus assembly protein PilM n=1 Tax=Clostridium bovifaecis TaxID=2184719 RepID=A0A6I6EPW5_9CLOT|nr:type IV pilus assembly protein PilM [Clostridium bovifaecis]
MLNPKLLSIEIGSKNIKLVQGIQKGNNNVVVEKAAMVDTPRDSFHEGSIRNTDAIKEVLSQVIENQNIKAKRVVFSTKSTSIITRIIEVPMAKPKELDAIIRFEMEQYLPINFEDYILKYRKLDEVKNEEGKKCRVSVAVFPKEMAKQYFDLAKELALKPYALDLTSNCINKLFSKDTMINSENYSLKETVVVIDLGYDYLELNIISNGILEFTRIISGGGSYLDANVGSQLYIEDKEAEFKKIRFGNLNGDANPENLEEDMINNSIRLVVDRWIREIDRMLDYFINTNKEKVINAIYLHGGSSNVKGLPKYMESMLNIKVRKIEDMNNILISSSGEINKESYLNAIGGIIRLSR